MINIKQAIPVSTCNIGRQERKLTRIYKVVVDELVRASQNHWHFSPMLNVEGSNPCVSVNIYIQIIFLSSNIHKLEQHYVVGITTTLSHNLNFQNWSRRPRRAAKCVWGAIIALSLSACGAMSIYACAGKVKGNFQRYRK